MSNLDTSSPKVSVAITTYNHERYIRQAVESALAQKMSADFEIVIADDCSTDKTLAILKELAAAAPEKIRLIAQSSNVGMQVNFQQTIAACRGQYIAILEGDDFWTDPTKLERQASILDCEPDCRLVFHRVGLLVEGESPNDLAGLYAENHPPVIGVEPLFEKNIIPTCSVLVRGAYLKNIPSWVETLPVGDWPRWILAIEGGYARFLDHCMATYRQHAAGVWSRKSPEEQIQCLFETLISLEKHGSPRVAEGAARRRRQIISDIVRSNDNLRRTYSYRLGHLLLTPARKVRNVLRNANRA